jgi:hypothetical protein
MISRAVHRPGFDPAVLDGVEGWLTLQEARRLYHAARSVGDGRSPIRVVEIGSWKGRSTIALASGLRDRGAGCVYAIDPHTGSVEHQKDGIPVDTFDEFSQNIQRLGLTRWVAPIREAAHSCSPRVDGAVSVLFVDGSHEYEDVMLDIDDWLPKLAEGAIVGFNDPGYSGVMRALCERIVCEDGILVEPEIVRGTLFMRYRPHERLTASAARELCKRLQGEKVKNDIKARLPTPVYRAAVKALALVRGG